jgi:hypothetical protein
VPDPTEDTAKSVIVFRFHGGTRDGQSLRSDRPADAKEVQFFWTLTWNGTVGLRFDVSVSAPNAPANERYQVKNKYDAGGEIHVACEHVG